MSTQVCLTIAPFIFLFLLKKAPAVNITFDFSRFVAVIVSRCQGFFNQQDVSGSIRFCPSTAILLFLFTYFRIECPAQSCGLGQLPEVVCR